MACWKSDVVKSTNKNGADIQWRVWTEGSTIIREFGYVGGKLQRMEKVIEKGKNIGRSNATTPEEQAILEAKSMYKRYVGESGVLPMLANTLRTPKDVREWGSVIAQPKLDGVRVLVSREGARTRTGKDVKSIDHIVLACFKHLREGEYLDGECFTWSMPFEEISGRFRKSLPCPGLEFHAFDIIDINKIDTPFSERFSRVRDIVKCVGKRNIVTVETVSATPSDFKHLHNKWVSQGYEGLIVRDSSAPYEIGQRSRSLLKYKEFDTSEFKITGVKEGVGKDAGTAIFTCGNFSVRPQGTITTRKGYWMNRIDHIGKMLTVKHQGLTDDGVPRFPIGLAIRDYE